MTTKDIINQMEKEFNRRVGTNKMDLYPSVRTLLESFGEEIISLVPKYGDQYEIEPFRAEQRLKVKEIISQISK